MLIRKLFWILFLAPIFVFAQKSDFSNLLQEAQNKLYNQPKEAAKISEYIVNHTTDLNTQATATLLLAKSYYIRRNYSESAKHALKAQKLSNETQDISLKTETKVFTIGLLQELELINAAINLWTEVTKIQESDKSLLDWTEAKRKQYLGFVAFEEKDYDIAIKNLEESETLFKKTGALEDAANTTFLLISAYIHNHEYDIAKATIEKQSIVNNYHKILIQKLLGDLYFNLKDYPTAIENYQIALEQVANFSNKNLEASILNNLSQAYVSIDNAPNFLEIKQKFNQVSSEIKNDKSNAVSLIYNFISTQEKEHSEQQIYSATRNLYLSLLLLLIIVVVGLSVFFIYHTKAKGYKILSSYLLAKPKEEIEPDKKANVSKNQIPEETRQHILEKLEEFEAGQEYINPDMSIALLASELNINTRYLSEIINRYKGNNFNGYINELRINYIIQKLKTDSVFLNYKISYLAEACGFSSHSRFATAFKNVTGVSPTIFVDFIKNRDEAL